MTFEAKYGPWALVTGAGRAEGLGFEFANQLAAKGLDLILVDILSNEAEARASEIRNAHGVHAISIGMDLGQKGFIEDLVGAVGEREVGLLVCNHMYTPKDTPSVLDMELVQLDAMIDINARAYTHLVHTFGNQMVSRGHGGIILVTSGAGIIATPYATSYAANKGYQRLLGEGLWYELKDTGVDVAVVVAGMMNTQVDGLSGYPRYIIMETEPVVQEVLEALGKRVRVIPGPFNKSLMFVQNRLMSVKAVVNQLGGFMAKGLGKR
jgi:short-subunit dehydrogenase